MSEHQLILTVENGRKWMSLNDRDQWPARHAKAAKWRKYAASFDVPHFQHVLVEARIWKPRNGRYDPHNLIPTLKHIIDGFVDAGLVPDDDHKHMVLDIDHGGVDNTKPPHLVITLREAK